VADALIYVRKSAVRYEEDRASPERQLANCIRICDEKGWSYEVYEDAEGHRSGRSEKHRPAWRDLKRQLGRRQVAAVVVNSLDRASRSPKDFFNFLDLLQKHDVELVSVHEQFDTTTAIGKAFLAILMVVASLESDLASERISDSVEYRRRRGVHVGLAPFGYDREDGTLVVNDDAQIVRLAMQLYASGSYSFRELAAELNRRGYRFKDRYGSKPFGKVGVRSMLLNAWLYAGRVPVGRERAGEYAEWYPGEHEAIVDAALAERVLAARRKRRKGVSRGVSRVFLLSGVLFCHECGSPLWGATVREWGRVVYRHRTKSCRPGRGSFEAVDLERRVIEVLDGLVLPPDVQEMVRERARRKMEERPDNRALAEALRRERGRLVRLKEMRLEGEFEVDEYRARKGQIVRVMEGLEARLGLPEYDAGVAFRRVADVGEIVRRGDPAQQRRAVGAVFERVEVSPASHDIARVVPRKWFGLFFRDVTEVLVAQRARRDSNPRPTA
jgi:site-specific DNA recombinase